MLVEYNWLVKITLSVMRRVLASETLPMAEFLVRRDLQESYSGYYDGSSAWREVCATDKAANVTDLCRALPHGRVIDIGAGEGSLLHRLSEIQFADELYAAEISTTGVEAIRRRHIPSVVSCDLFDGYTLPYTDRSFDLAILSHVLEHVEYPRRLLAEAGRVAEHVYVEVPLEDTLRLSRDFVPNKTGHINFYSPTTIRRLFQTSGFEVLAQKVVNPSKSVYGFGAPPHWRTRFWIKELALRLWPGFAPRVWSYHSAIVGRYRREASR